MPTTRPPQAKHTEQNVLNDSFDEAFNVLAIENLGYDGSGLQRMNANNLQIYTIASGEYTYFCFSAPGTPQATAGWRIFRIDGSGNLMFADADADYDNVATDPTVLTYSYS